MKKILSLLLSTALLVSCVSIKTVSIKGNYTDPLYQITSDKRLDQVWDKLLDVFAKRGLAIKIIDKSSGVIVSEPSILTVTTENKDFTVKDSKAFIVVPQTFDPANRKYTPITKNSEVRGEWNVRVKQDGEQTLLYISISNIKYEAYDYHTRRINKDIILIDYKSTGVFEKIIEAVIK
jgi:hypothetical protein